MKIINKEVKKFADDLSFYLEIKTDETFDDKWIDAYYKALCKKPFTSLRSSGGPTVDRLEFYGNLVVTKPFHRCAFCELEEFLKEFSDLLDAAACIKKVLDKIEEARLIEIAKKKEEVDKEVSDINEKINGKSNEKK